MLRARAARPRGFDSLPSQDPDPGRCDFYSSAGSSKIKIWTSCWHKAQLALCHDEVRILIFDDAAEQEESQRPKFRSAQLYSNQQQKVSFRQNFSSYKRCLDQET
jgi:hypothetical protein